MALNATPNPFTDPARLLLGAAAVAIAAALLTSFCLIWRPPPATSRDTREFAEAKPLGSAGARWHGNGPNAVTGGVWTGSDSYSVGGTATALRRVRRQIPGYPGFPTRGSGCSDTFCLAPHPCSSLKSNMGHDCYAICVNGKKSPVCHCNIGFRYEPVSETCVIMRVPCESKNCLNNGICEEVSELVQETLGRTYNCKCKPAWQGLSCEQARNPCRQPKNQASCGPFECRRSPIDEIHGFLCRCPTGFTATTQGSSPSCRDNDECVTTKPCRNGGECVNTVGSFKCNCKWGFRGDRCEIQPPEPFWMSWSQWSPCSTTCSTGLQYRRRNCSLAGSCMGTRKDTRTCRSRRQECFGHHVEFDPRVRAGGAGHQKDEDAILDDAWYFREYQLLKIGLNNRVTSDDDLLNGHESLLYNLVPLLYVLVAAELLVIAFLLRRNRARWVR